MFFESFNPIDSKMYRIVCAQEPSNYFAHYFTVVLVSDGQSGGWVYMIFTSEFSVY